MQAADYSWYVKQKLNKNTEILLPTALNMVDYSMCRDCETGKQKIANTVPPEHKITYMHDAVNFSQPFVSILT